MTSNELLRKIFTNEAQDNEVEVYISKEVIEYMFQEILNSSQDHFIFPVKSCDTDCCSITLSIDTYSDMPF